MSTYSPDLRIELITTGDQAGTWGTTTNTNLGTVIEDAISGYVTVSVTSANQAFTALNGAADEARNALIRLTTTTTAAFSVYAPPSSKQYIIWNNSGYAATIYNSTSLGNTTAAGTGVTIADGDRVVVFSNGTNFYSINAANVSGTVAIANGGTGQTTANAAFNALAPSQTSANNKYLKSDGTNTSWDAIDISTADITGVLLGANGGTGVNNSGKTVTLAGNLATSGAFNITLTATGGTNVTLPTTGTLATLSGTETFFNKTINGSSNTLVSIPNSSLVNNSVTINGSGVSLGGSITITAANPNALTIGTGLSGTSYNGSAAVTIAIDSTVVTLSGSQTLTNKTLTSPTLTTPALGTPASGVLSNCTGLPLTTGVAGTLPVANGGTGATTAANARTNLGLVIGTDVPSPTGSGASGTWNISISGNAATATSATSATNATNATKLATTNFTIEESGGNLVFKYGGTTIASMDSSGNLTMLANVTAYGTP